MPELTEDELTLLIHLLTVHMVQKDRELPQGVDMVLPESALANKLHAARNAAIMKMKASASPPSA
jgi:hypothetical protein